MNELETEENKKLVQAQEKRSQAYTIKHESLIFYTIKQEKTFETL